MNSVIDAQMHSAAKTNMSELFVLASEIFNSYNQLKKR